MGEKSKRQKNSTVQEVRTREQSKTELCEGNITVNQLRINNGLSRLSDPLTNERLTTVLSDSNKE